MNMSIALNDAIRDAGRRRESALNSLRVFARQHHVANPANDAAREYYKREYKQATADLTTLERIKHGTY